VTRGWLPQGAGSPCLNGGGTAAAVAPVNPGSETTRETYTLSYLSSKIIDDEMKTK